MYVCRTRTCTHVNSSLRMPLRPSDVLGECMKSSYSCTQKKIILFLWNFWSKSIGLLTNTSIAKQLQQTPKEPNFFKMSSTDAAAAGAATENSAAAESQPRHQLYYFDIAGRGEGLRLALSHAKIPFDDVRVVRQLTANEPLSFQLCLSVE